jgi:transcription factor IIIB subunit 2
VAHISSCECQLTVCALQRRKTSNKPRDATTPSGSTAAESVRNLIKKNPKYSKRINYDALKDLFVDTADDEKDDNGLYTIDSRDETAYPDGMEIIEEEGGAVGVQANKAKAINGAETDGNLEDEDADGEEEGSDKGEDIIDTGWEEIYEQEV